MDEPGLDIEKTKHRILYGERICDERMASHRGARMQAFGRGQIRESEERPIVPTSPINTFTRRNSHAKSQSQQHHHEL